MFSNLHVALRPGLLAIFLLVASSGAVFADGNYGGTDPPTPPPPPPGGGGLAIGGITVPVEDPIQTVQSLWTQLRLLVVQCISAGEITRP